MKAVKPALDTSLEEVDDTEDYQYGAVSDLYDAAEPAASMTKEKLIETGKDVADFATDFIPGVSEAKDIYSLSENVSKGDYVGAGIDATSLALGIVPGVGDLARKGFRSSVAPLRKLFDKLPEQARRYITIRSARVFHDRTLGANTLHKFSSEDEARSLSVMKQAEMATGDNTIFDSDLQNYIVNR